MEKVRGNIEDILNAIESANSFLITSHIRPEGDCIGSQLAMAYFLKSKGKKVWVVNEDTVPFNYRFLPGWRIITQMLPSYAKPEAAVVVDCPNLFRIGNVKSYITHKMKIINIDHHISNDNFGTFWINPHASSTGEMIWELLKTAQIPLTKKHAQVLYTAIFTDTGGFRFSNTTERSLVIAGEMVRMGVKPQQVASCVYETNPLSRIKLLGLSLSTLRSTQDGRLVWFWVTKKMLRQSHSSMEEADDFINYARSIDKAQIVIFFKQESKEIKVSFRAKNSIDVNKIAAKFKGGGHKAAAGCSIKGTVKDVEKKVIDYVSKIIV
jgi:phosphoesterase RecJ-like protein